MTTETFLHSQEQETIQQERQGITARLATITCRCGWERALVKMYKCLYCGEWFCEMCAEIHFGKTRKEYHDEASKDKA